MKKKDILKAIGIVLGVYVVLTWIIPTGTFSGATLTKNATEPVGIVDLVKYPVSTISTSIFILSALVILLIGGFYGVLNKTGAYSKVIEGITKKFKGNEKTFLIITILVLGVLSSLTGLVLPLFVLVPFFAAIILSLGYNKMTAMVSTVGSILVGNLGSTYGFNINGYVTYFFQNKINDSIWYRVALFILVIAALLIFILKTAKIEKKKAVKKTTKSETKKSEEKKEEVMIPLYEKNIDKKKSITPLIVISIITLVFILVGMFNWENVFGIKLFSDINTAVTDFKLNGYPIFKNIIGTIGAIGSWTNVELCFILIVATLVIKCAYSIKCEDLFDGFVKGIKEMVPVAIYVFIANILFLVINSSASGSTIYPTLANFFLEMTEKFNIVTYGFASLIGSVVYNDFPYMLNSLYAPVTALTQDYNLVGIVSQGIHGLVMLIAPTSVILIAGLRYFDISYKEWFKRVWKYLLIALASIIVVAIIMTLV